MIDQVEYQVRPVTRFVITRYSQHTHSGVRSGAVEERGEFKNETLAYTVADALAFKEREDLGWPPGDERMQFAQKGGESAS